METIPMLLKEMEQEAQTTRKMLSRIPNDKFDWQPHEKSMTVRRLSTHIAEIPGWVKMAIATDELDFSDNPYKPEVINDTQHLLEVFEQSYKDGYSSLSETNESELLQNWTLRDGNKVYSVRPKVDVIRMAFSQTVHHRAQLGVFLRLLNVPIPGSYGPSADETQFDL
ncbi:putative damage-inducible protein DinB [Mucilaginibacter frigoritolerans]|uniref:Putative damage-inducible protein DinB n=1 Tax=Mucilaginibacter frigoritolerans TaxID=652788 RepID=A0A562UFD1_9SPHI|nr:DinB family protein [Mucilaginibacter frigoritolerans]TWJ04494.1 putative damage-inducible protein DinB [Mucilaginibacter frigoritolerans]